MGGLSNRALERKYGVGLAHRSAGAEFGVAAAIVDRLTFGGNLIETGTESYRLTHEPT
ncbi:hypothetical protein GCM10009630_31660 [Kribbella jejuensis]